MTRTRPAPLHAGAQGLLLEPADAAIGIASPPRAIEHVDLGRGAWLDVQRHFVDGADALFRQLLEHTPWKHERRAMYDRVVDVPRLTKFFDADEQWPHPALSDLAAELSSRYVGHEPEGFATAGLCLYRDGVDSVAWHGDTIGRGSSHDVLVAIVSLGAPRTLALRPRGSGASMRWTLDSGDLLVMGGSCQRTFEHAVPKTTRPVGPRISVQFRPAGVR